MNLEELRKFKPQIQALAREYKIDPDSIRVFGSVARGDATDVSDVDFLVKPLGGCSIFDISAFFADTRQMIDCDVDVVSERAIFPAMRDAILGDAVML
jgi:uncharacterized protein